MKICYIAPSDSIHTARWVNFFAENGDEVHLIFFEEPIGDFDSRIILHPIRSHYKKSPGDTHQSIWKQIIRSGLNMVLAYTPLIPKLMTSIDFFLVKKEIRSIRPDIVHAHFLTTYGFLGVLSGFHPFCVSVWGSDILIYSDGIMKYISRSILKKADLITCDGENTRKAILELGIPQNKIRLIFHGIDTKKFSPSMCNRDFLGQLLIKENPVVIYTRGFKSMYDPETIIRSIPYVMKEIADVNFIIAGRGPEEQRIRSIAESLGVLPAIKFTGLIPHKQLPMYLASSDVYVSTSLSDGGVAVSTFEAMACGVSPIVTDVGDNNKWIKDGENGIIIPVRSPEILAEKIIYLLKHPEERTRFGINNRSIIVEHQDYHKEMGKVHQLYKSLMKGS
jgi:glycosyltransferase involved in cell wall biosynthesis